MAAYATRRDVYRYGLPRGTLGSPGRLVASSLASTDTLTLEEHGFEDDDAVVVRAAGSVGSLPAPLVSSTVYYARRVSDSTFQLAATPGGAAINLTTDGVEMLVAAALPFDEVLEYYSRWVDDFIPSHAVPLEEPYPIGIVATVAELAAKKLQFLSGVSSESVDAAELAAKAKLERWAKGIPLRDAAATTARTNLAVSTPSSTPRNWGSGGTLP